MPHCCNFVNKGEELALTTVIAITGNPGSAERIGFGCRIFEKQKLILRESLDNLDPVALTDGHGEVAFPPLPTGT
jgi:hypothetical protein